MALYLVIVGSVAPLQLSAWWPSHRRDNHIYMEADDGGEAVILASMTRLKYLIQNMCTDGTE